MNPEPGNRVQYVCLHTGNRHGRRMMNVSYGSKLKVISNEMNVGSFSSYISLSRFESTAIGVDVRDGSENIA